MADNDQLLFLELSKALSRPSKAYRAAEAGLGIPGSILEGYLTGTDASDKIRQSRFGRKSLEEVLGGVPEGLEGFGHLTLDQGERAAKPISAIADLRRATREHNDKPSRFQQTKFFANNRPVLVDPTPGTGGYFYGDTFERVDFGHGGPKVTSEDGATIPNLPSFGNPPGKPPTITPPVPPTVPGEQVSRSAELNKLLGDIAILRKNYKPEYVGMVDNLATGLKQLTGYKAEPQAATFKSTSAGLRNKVLNLLSGAAISPDEARRLLQQVPNEARSDVDYLAKVDNFEREIKSILSERQKAFSSAGYRTPSVQSVGEEQTAKVTTDPLGLFK